MGLRPVTPQILNYTIALINTEEPIVLPDRIMDLTIRLRNTAHSFKVAFKSGESATNFLTLDSSIPALSAEDIQMSNQTLFVQSPDAGATLEILLYT